jgi:hypothetical protein
MKARLLATVSIALLMAGIVTVNLNSAVWAKDYSSHTSKHSYKSTEMINGKVNTMTDDNGNIKTNDNGNTKTNDNGNIKTNDNGNTKSNDNGNIQSNSQSNDNGNIKTNDNQQSQTSDETSFSCQPEPECGKSLSNILGMVGNPLKLIP